MTSPTARKQKTIKTLTIVAAILIVVLAIFGVSYLLRMANYQNIVSSLVIENPPLAQVANGTYEGSCDADIVGARVNVSVADGRITSIELVEHKTERGQSAEVIVDSIVAEQRVDVDTVSGATNSSKVIQKAVENALRA